MYALKCAENPQQVIETAYDHGITFLITPTFMVAATAKQFLVKALKESTIRREDIFSTNEM